MRSSTPERRYVSSGTWFRANGATLEAVTTAILLATAASMILMATGTEELAVPVLALALGVLVAGLALSRLFHHLEVEGLPLVEQAGQ